MYVRETLSASGARNRTGAGRSYGARGGGGTTRLSICIPETMVGVATGSRTAVRGRSVGGRLETGCSGYQERVAPYLICIPDGGRHRV